MLTRTTLPESCQYLEFFWSVFSRIWSEYREMQSNSPYSVQMQKNTDQKSFGFGHFSRCDAVGGSQHRKSSTRRKQNLNLNLLNKVAK